MPQQEISVGTDEFTIVFFIPDKGKSKPTPEKLYPADWLEKADKILEIVLTKTRLEQLFEEKMEQVENSIPAGYSNALTFRFRPWYLMLAWHEYFSAMGVCLKFSAYAWAAYQQEYAKQFGEEITIADFLRMLKDDFYAFRISRIDLVADYKNYPCPINPNAYLEPNTIYEKLRKAEYVIKDYADRQLIKSMSAYDIGGKYATLYIGSRKNKSAGFMRIYDKRKEQLETKGFRLDEAFACESWVRFEASFRQEYAHAITAELLEVDNKNLPKLIAKYISDKYRFFITATDEPTNFTDDLLEIAQGITAATLTSPGARDNSLRQSIQYLKSSSGLFSTLYKVWVIWGNEGEEKLMAYLLDTYRQNYKQEAGNNKDLKHWTTKHGREHLGQKLEDVFLMPLE